MHTRIPAPTPTPPCDHNWQAIKNFFDEIFAFGQHEEAMYCFTDSMRPYTYYGYTYYGYTYYGRYCFTDSMRPFVDGPFADEIKTFVEDKVALTLPLTLTPTLTLTLTLTL